MGGRGTKFRQSRRAEIIELRKAAGGGGADAAETGTAPAGGGGAANERDADGRWIPSSGTLQKAVDRGESYNFTETMRKQYAGKVPKFNAEQLNALETYVGADFDIINEMARDIAPATPYAAKTRAERGPELMKDARKVARMTNKMRLDDDLITFRGTNIRDEQQYQDLLTPGTIFRDKGIMSTSLSRGTARAFVDIDAPNPVMFLVAMPKGTRMLPVDSVRGYSYEKEFIPRFRTKFRVIGRAPQFDQGKVKAILITVDNPD